MPPAGGHHQPPGGHGTERTGNRHQREPADPPDSVEEQLRTPVLVEPRPAGGRPGERVAAEDRTLLDHELARLDVVREVDRARGGGKLHHADGAEHHDDPQPRQAQPRNGPAVGRVDLRTNRDQREPDLPDGSNWPPSAVYVAPREPRRPARPPHP
jgi:hypothetical protein